jgi:hypothetical protein
MRKIYIALCLLTSLTGLHAQDATQTFLTSPNFPLNRALPVDPAAVPGDGLALAAGSTNAFSLVMGVNVPGANMTTGQSIRDTFYFNYLVGNLAETIGCPQDTGQGCNSSPFAAVARHYAVGDPNDLHVMGNNGIQLRAICSANHTDCSPGHVYGAMIRLPFAILPNMTVRVRYKTPKGRYSWAPIWLFSGSEISPGPGGNPWQGFGTDMSLVQEPVSKHDFEIDMNDNYPRWTNTPSVAPGHQLDFGTPNNYGVAWTKSPYWVYGASTAGYNFYPAADPAFEALPMDWSLDYHDLVLSWNGTANRLYEFVDGVLVTDTYMEYGQAPTYTDGFTNTVKTQGMSLMIGNQAIPSWLPGGSSTIENDGIPNGWTMTVQAIQGWYGIIQSPNLYKPVSSSSLVERSTARAADLGD